MNYGVYFHIPFCIKKCRYCDFLSFPIQNISAADRKKYFDALSEEWNTRKELINGNIDSIYIGGGTPSCIDPNIISDFLRNIYRDKKVCTNAEITVEVNPGTVTKEHFDIYRRAGVNRISLGVQTTHERLLKSLGRIHSNTDSERAVMFAHDAGFTNINCDIISAIPQIGDEPGETLREFACDLSKIVSLGATHISVYSIIVEEDTELYRMFQSGQAHEIDDVIERKMYYMIKKCFSASDLFQYEISNYAKKGYESIHNLKYWNCMPYIGFGLGAASYYPQNTDDPKSLYIRESNTKNLNDYINFHNERDSEILDCKEQMKEFMMLGFRKTDGPSHKVFKERFLSSYFDVFDKEIKALEKEKLIETAIDSAKLTKKGFDFANAVFREFV